MLAQEQNHISIKIFRTGIYCGLSRILQEKALGFNSKPGLLKLMCVFILVKTGDFAWWLRIFHPVTSSWAQFIEINNGVSILAANKLSMGIRILITFFKLNKKNTISVDAVRTQNITVDGTLSQKMYIIHLNLVLFIGDH